MAESSIRKIFPVFFIPFIKVIINVCLFSFAFLLIFLVMLHNAFHMLRRDKHCFTNRQWNLCLSQIDSSSLLGVSLWNLSRCLGLCKGWVSNVPWLPEVFLSQSDGTGEEKPLVQAVEFFENAGPMGCRFIFPESDFDPSNSIGSRNLSVLTSTLIGLATESSSNRFSILLSILFPVATGHNQNAAKSRESRF